MDNLLFGAYVSRENYRILIVDDDESTRILFCRIIEKDKYTVKTATTGKEALQIARNFKPHLILTDLKMPGMDGMSLIEECNQFNSDTDFIVVTAYGDVDTAIKSMKMGVLEYILKPVKAPDEFRHAISMAYERRTLIDENFALKNELDKDMPPLEIIFGGMDGITDKIRAVAPTSSTVRLSGETGTGKGLISKVIHQLSGRKGPFVEINCASVPETLLESEFFGHEKGSFTGATSSKKGKFELATDGTIFLDEISEMDYAMQAKLLRVLQDRTFEKLGSNLTQITNARVICATNKDLHKAISEGDFREDLFFRLNVFPLELKPLRERKSHIPVLIRYLTNTISARIGKKINCLPDNLDKEIKGLLAYNWPGNVRELQNLLERAIILSQDNELDLTGILSGETPSQKKIYSGTLRDIEKMAIEDTLARIGGNRKQVAEALGISQRALQYKIKEYGLNS